MAQEDETGDEQLKESTAKRKEKKKASKKQKNDDEGDEVSTSGLPKDSGWVECRSDFPKDVPITKVRVKGSDGDFQLFVEDKPLRADNPLIPDYHVYPPCFGIKKKENIFQVSYLDVNDQSCQYEIELDDDIWNEISLPSHVKFHSCENSSDIQFFVDRSLSMSRPAKIEGIYKGIDDSKARSLLADLVKVKPLLEADLVIPQDTGWVQCRIDLPIGLPITKIRFRRDKDTGTFPGTFSYTEKLDKSMAIKISEASDALFKDAFEDVEPDENGWCEVSYSTPLYFYQGKTSANVEFFIDKTAVAENKPFTVLYKKKIPDGYPSSQSLKGSALFVAYDVQGLGLKKEGYLVGDRLYERDKDNNLFTNKQLVDGVLWKALESDTIVKVLYFDEMESQGSTVKYANGDSLLLTTRNGDYGNVLAGRIHREGGVLDIKERKRNENQMYECVLTWPNGDRYVGRFNTNIYFSINDLMEPLKLYTGQLTKADGTVVEYRSGKDDKERAEIARLEKEREKQELLKKINEVEAVLAELSKKYGKQYAVAAMSGKVIVGMPKELFLKVFGSYPYYVTLDSESRYSQCYRLYKNPDLFSPKFVAWVWISNGQVSKITYN